LNPSSSAVNGPRFFGSKRALLSSTGAEPRRSSEANAPPRSEMSAQASSLVRALVLSAVATPMGGAIAAGCSGTIRSTAILGGCP
jgi:hypothetical protein